MSLHLQYFLALSATMQKKMGSANSLAVSISAWETNGALTGPVHRIRKGGEELVFLIIQPAIQPPVHIRMHPLHLGFLFMGRGGEKKRETFQGNETLNTLRKPGF